ncbi:MAG: helix-turn-helix domain-containing protein [Clostridiales bacterium]|nr:helix-turn-helix domain-containing protein [Clostridiales bacterium]
MSELTFRDPQQVDSRRILYTPSAFARSCLVHLQEVGRLRALSPHRSQRSDLASYLFFVVLEGEGELTYDGAVHALSRGSCVFIDCRRAYSHATSRKLWSLAWAHFDGPTMHGIYQKYVDRGGLPCFRPGDVQPYLDLLAQLQETAAADDHVRDMHINELLCALLSLLMQAGWRPAAHRSGASSRSRLADVKVYLDSHYNEKIALDDLAEKFFINKFHLTRLFREQYGSTIVNYLLSLRISRAKELLRFTELSVEEIGARCGMPEANYFSRAFRKIEGVSPTEFRRQW